MFERILPYAVAFLSSLLLTLLLTPAVRCVNRRFGLIDKPDKRRINKVPIPRGGGLAIVASVTVASLVVKWSFPLTSEMLGSPERFWRCTAIALMTAALGYADDKYSLPPKMKLLGQTVLAILTWVWAGLGFSDLWPSIPVWLDGMLTVLWIIGAVNAFNLIDGLDGLATGLAFIATLGMAGALFYAGHTNSILYYFCFAGGLLGFLRYNYNPASIFLGDCGSMYIGWIISVLPLCSHAENSFLVSVGVPLLAMGVPIFDTSLAIFRRSIRHLLNRGSAEVSSGQVMTADVDHLHHRILRSFGFNQRKAAWSLYALALLLVTIGMVGLLLKDKAAGLWIVAIMLISIIIFKDSARIELFDTGRLLNQVAHEHSHASRRRWARAAVPFYVVTDILILLMVFFGVTLVLDKPLFQRDILMIALPIRVISIFAFLSAFRVYRTVWSRALLSNFVCMFSACAAGSLIGTVLIYYAPGISKAKLLTGTILYALLPFLLLSSIRVLRSFVRDMFYHLDCQRLKGRKDVSRILVYGAGLRYRTFRRELVRRTSANNRIIVGIIDDDVLLRGHYIGGLRVLGPLSKAPELINELNVDSVVVACEITDEWRRVVRDTLDPTGVKVTYFNLSETEL